MTRNGEKSKRTDLKDVDLSKYIGAAVEALSGGGSAEAAGKSAANAIAV